MTAFTVPRHLAETGYYLRQGGPYPPFTSPMGSIVRHKHQKAAYCGLHFFDSDAYPPEYREKLYMGNIHGGCLNCDELTRDGSTYFAKPRPDFLTANDVWFTENTDAVALIGEYTANGTLDEYKIRNAQTGGTGLTP